MPEHYSDAEALCPNCWSETGWDKQDTYAIGAFAFTQRLQVCIDSCGWVGSLAWFPHNGNPPIEPVNLLPSLRELLREGEQNA
jgi:hypothetical protein